MIIGMPGPRCAGAVVAEGREWQVENGVAAQNGEAAMGLMDRVKEQAAMAAQRATGFTVDVCKSGRHGVP